MTVRENDQLKFELDAQRRRQAAGDRRSIQSVLDEIQLPNQSVQKDELHLLEKHIDKVQGRVMNRNSDFEKYQDTSDST